MSAVLIHQVWAGDEAAWDHSVARVVEDALRDLPDAIVRSAGAEGNCPQIAAG
ncbi:hypothetical protein [Kribbella qitaiheensis]|uniref:hypothetical protein n=1 Tax=Kribbella qitaiheensis TaxID=1544730 RepID=UPI0016281495|nr:hypothetical protein [Kribbella qitaiheensis]